MVALTSLLIIIPVGSIIDRSIKNEGEEINKLTYQQCFMKFPTDYDRENPVTKNEGFLRVLDQRINDESSEAAKERLRL